MMTCDRDTQIIEMATILTRCTCDGQCMVCELKDATTKQYACIDFDAATKLYEAEFRKLKHSQWVHHRSTSGGIHDTYRCENCGYETGWTTDYCGGCGADMKH